MTTNALSENAAPVEPLSGPLASRGQTHALVQQYVLSLARHYGYEGEIEERIWRKVDRILTAASDEELAKLTKAACSSAFTHVLSLWGRGKAFGPISPENMEKKARAAERIANLHVLKGDDDAAKRQLEKAEEFRSVIQGS